MIALALLIVFPAAAWAGPRVAESNVIPDRLIRSRGYINYNYDVHAVELEMEGERVTMYRYRWLRMMPPVKAEDVDKEIGDAKSLDSKDAVTLEGRAPICTETAVPDWSIETQDSVDLEVAK